MGHLESARRGGAHNAYHWSPAAFFFCHTGTWIFKKYCFGGQETLLPTADGILMLPPAASGAPDAADATKFTVCH
jgi:hypothetical protein